MNKLFLIIILILFLDGAWREVKANNTGNDISGIYNSKYGRITIASHDNKITGVYEYYDKWSENYHEFLDINVFYIWRA